jgi:predicted CxxxxCH...CXXCH cytochrome family protein
MHSRVVPVLASLLALALASCDSRPAEGGGGGLVPISGAHTIHLTGTIAQPIGCAQCHNAAFQVTLEGSLARANGAQGTFNTATLTCSNVYCHDGGPTLPIGGGTVPTPVWNPPSRVACGGCHALPGGAVDASAWHPAVATDVQCALCHPGYTNTTVNVPLHVNGVVDLTVADLGTNCVACHGDTSRILPPGASSVVKAAPPVDRKGRSDTLLPSVGAHQAHLLPGAAAIASPIACGECHVVPADLSHVGPAAYSPAKLAWGPLASSASAVPAYNPLSVTCTNYCHGQTLAAGGTNTAPVWTRVDGTQAACGTCHASPPSDLPHTLHAAPTQLHFPCSACHPQGYAIDAVGPAAVPLHVNGVRNLNAALPGWNPAAPGPNGWTGTSVGCHGGTRFWNAGFPNTGCF